MIQETFGMLRFLDKTIFDAMELNLDGRFENSCSLVNYIMPYLPKPTSGHGTMFSEDIFSML
jgi:hypothetical protein